MSNEITFDNLSDEQKAKLANLKSAEELQAFLEEENLDTLSDDILEAISGGARCYGYDCPGFYPCGRDMCRNYRTGCPVYIVW